MITHKKILEELGIKEDTKFHNHSYLYKSILEAMEIAAAQSFNEGYSSGKESMVVNPTYPTFEDYLKKLENGSN